MTRFLFLSILFCAASLSVSAQLNDSLPWLKLPERITAFEEIVGPLSPRQQNQIADKMLEMVDQNRFNQAAPPLRQQRQRLGRSIIGIFNNDQKETLRSQTEGGQNPIQALLRDFPPRPRE